MSVKISVVVLLFFIRIAFLKARKYYGYGEIAFYSKLYAANRENLKYKDVPYFKQKEVHKRTVEATHFGLNLNYKSTFKITRELVMDRFCKKIGLANEIQVGDTQFDNQYYISSDCSFFRKKIKNDSQLRSQIDILFKHLRCSSVWCDGKTLLIEIKGGSYEDSKIPKVLVTLSNQLIDGKNNPDEAMQNRFETRSFFLDSVVWSIVTFGFISFIDLLADKVALHVNGLQIFFFGLLVTLTLAAALIMFVAFFMKGSSRGHRIITERLLMLILSLPFAGIQLASDLNTKLDQAPAYIISTEILKLKSVQKKKGNLYYLEVSSKQLFNLLNPNFPTDKQVKNTAALNRLKSRLNISDTSSISIDRSTYDNLSGAKEVQLHIAPGFFGFPWYKSIIPL